MENEHDFYSQEVASLLERLEKAETADDRALWWEIWDTVHHQGDVYISSYVAVPKVFEIYSRKNWFDANLPALFAVIENCRQKEGNPKLPSWLKEEYFQTLEKTVKYCAKNISVEWNRELLHSFLLLLCAVKQNQRLFELLDVVSSEEDEEFLLKLYYES